MRSFFDLAHERRSVRKYQYTKIPRQDLLRCVEAARHSPSACNSQPWKFIIVDDPDKRSAIARSFSPHYYSMNSFTENAPAFIILISERSKFTAWLGGKVRNTDFRRIDIGIAASHIVLQAQELGIGTCILGWFNEGNIKKVLGIPRAKKIDLIISLGYPEKDALLPEKQLKPLNEVLSLNAYLDKKPA